MAALDLLGRRWVLRILWEMREGTVGFRALQQRCDDMSSSVLRDRLHELRDAGIVTSDAGTYELSALGIELLAALGPLWNWTARWDAALSRRRRR